MIRDGCVLLLLYGISLIGLQYKGIYPPPPRIYFFVSTTSRYLTTHGIFLLERQHITQRAAVAAICAAIGMGLVWSYRLLLVKWGLLILLGFLFVLAAKLRSKGFSSLRLILIAGAFLFFGYATVWNLNYIFASATPGRVLDPALLQMDLTIYGWALGLPRKAAGMFPLVNVAPVFELLENAYGIFFFEILAVFFVVCDNGRNLQFFFRNSFSCYFLGLLIFFLVPSVGPCIYFPETFDSAYHDTQTYKFMHGMYTEYEAKQGSSVNGLGYFVAIPSLHVAIASLLQSFLWSFPAHFWMFLLINAMIILSTFLLGYHYFIDVPAGILLALVVRFVVVKLEFKRT